MHPQTQNALFNFTSRNLARFQCLWSKLSNYNTSCGIKKHWSLVNIRCYNRLYLHIRVVRHLVSKLVSVMRWGHVKWLPDRGLEQYMELTCGSVYKLAKSSFKSSALMWLWPQMWKVVTYRRWLRRDVWGHLICNSSTQYVKLLSETIIEDKAMKNNNECFAFFFRTLLVHNVRENLLNS